MNRRMLLAYILAPAFSAIGLALIGYGGRGRISRVFEKVPLPPPRYDGNVSIEYALKVRRSIREYEDKPLKLEHVSQLAWAGQGITDKRYGFRTAPSAGATYPLEIYIVVKKNGVEGLSEGIYHYLPREHMLELVKKGDYSRELMDACLDQEWVGEAAINIVVTAIYERTTYRYGDRGRIRYVHMEVGHVGQNIYLQCVSLGLGCVVIGAFYDEKVKKILEVDEEPLYVIPVGVKKGGWL
ncbi:MAG: SagB/ThcOx family dehydrogenase [Candidatus Bathyarchaeia archaeon]